MKITKKDYFKMIMREVEGKQELVDFCQREIEALERKNSKKAMSKTQKENENIKEVLIEVLTRLGTAVTVTEVNAEVEFTEYSNQKLSALLNQLFKAGTIQKTIEKGKSKFYVNLEEVEEV